MLLQLASPPAHPLRQSLPTAVHAPLQLDSAELQAPRQLFPVEAQVVLHEPSVLLQPPLQLSRVLAQALRHGVTMALRQLLRAEAQSLMHASRSQVHTFQHTSSAGHGKHSLQQWQAAMHPTRHVS